MSMNKIFIIIVFEKKEGPNLIMDLFLFLCKAQSITLIFVNLLFLYQVSISPLILKNIFLVFFLTLLVSLNGKY